MTNRRDFIRASAALGAMPFLPPFSISSANAADTSGYKALVCVFLFGGNDSHNLIVPRTTSEYNTYSAARGGLAEMNGLALPLDSLLSVSPMGMAANSFGLHPAMTNLATLFNTDKKLAVVANTGPLLAPTTLLQYQNRSVPLPPQLFSHSDMQMHWQTMRPDYPADTGWGGRMADVFRAAASGLLPVSTSLGGGNIFMKGDITSAYSVTPVKYKTGVIDNTTRIARTPAADVYWNWTGTGVNSRPQNVFVNNINDPRASLLEQQYAGINKASLDVGAFVTNAMYEVNSSTYTLKNAVPGNWPTTNRLAAQLHSVAAMIAARAALGVTREIFFVSLGGFDNHGDQFGRDLVSGNKTLLAGKHYDLLRTLDEALSVFYRATDSMGVANNVTTMTMSDFGRTLRSSGQGSDHGWGGHQLVLGGAVKGGRIAGDFPMPALGTSVDVGEGRLLPAIASDAYIATLANWMGASPAEVASIVPNLSRFNTQTLDLMA
ncbi:MAG: DUF1501 domain-containing protein [Rhizobacter sp.]|nr:DUF1501 domain-containing protein [Burkholderiales bacterium]